MKIGILGLGVIGTTYAYAFQKAGHEIYHIVRENRRASAPSDISVHILDGRYDPKGEEKDDNYHVTIARPGEAYDFILISVASGKLADALKTITDNDLNGTLILFCNLWDERKDIEAVLEDRPYIMGFPTAGGHMENGYLNCVLFDHIMLEGRNKSSIPNYDDLIMLLDSADIKQEIPYDMVEWIWIHMAINAGVTSTAAREGNLDDPNRLARELMADSKALSMAVKCIRETLRTVSARGVDLKKYKDELMPYRIPAGIAGFAMKRLFAGNELTSRIMTLHNDINDILYGCMCVYNEGKKRDLELPMFYGNIDRVSAGMKSRSTAC